MDKESALNYFEVLTVADDSFPNSDTSISIAVADGEYGVSVSGPPVASGEVFGGFINDLLSEGYNVEVTAEHENGITNLVVSFA